MNDSILEQLLTKMVETSNNNITITDENGLILDSNPNHWTIYGLESSRNIGVSVFELEEKGILEPSITAAVIKERKPIQILQQTKTGRIVMSTGYPIFDVDGQIIRVLSYAQDQTEIKNLQFQYEQLQRKIKGYQTEVEELREKGSPNLIFRSKEMQHITKTISRVAKTDATILFLGESGVGKSLLARSIHSQSDRLKEPFIEVNCSTIPESLFESEMFGYEPGAFTGALKQGKQGLIEQADGGTLFLDEIGELPLGIQVKLLKVLQEKRIMRVGGKKERQIDFRLVAATNQNLEEMVNKGTFRLDLYYRLNVIPLHIPALRERREDITILIQHYVHQVNEKYNFQKSLHPSTYEALIQYRWPGNVRELENLVERMMLIAEETTIYPDELPNSIQGINGENMRNNGASLESLMIKEKNLKKNIEQVERRLLQQAAEACRTTYDMAEYLGISQPSVIRKLKKYGISIK
ncbi:sigma 54-interacting transcriptional regulator [Neobacillus sp. DY30]|uniref:sigma-54 interaction domain-containing protein n=1 Tax=Neobacillus sp. DY30 TaxID=3047871 RepID=UPI0024C07ED7|nr:sigma 54-interacting transcriptional regulator [Neobacillus sp. DY30]WHY01794.1 sigma 54-interacting transcriptional regulator [Neobacillus sp. DY30]